MKTLILSFVTNKFWIPVRTSRSEFENWQALFLETLAVTYILHPEKSPEVTPFNSLNFEKQNVLFFKKCKNKSRKSE